MRKHKEIHKFAIGKERLEAFCDAVIAIAITLLVLEMKIPQLGPNNKYLLTALLHNFPTYISTIISFFIIGCYWINHHRLSNSIKHISHGYIILTLLWLFTICLIPYSTELVGDYLLSSNIYIVTAIYMGVNGFVVLFWVLIWKYIKKANLLKESINMKAYAFDTKLIYITIIIWFLLFLICFLNPYLSILGVIILTLFYYFPRKPLF